MEGNGQMVEYRLDFYQRGQICLALEPVVFFMRLV